MIVLKNVSRFSEHVIGMGGVFQPNTAAQYILIYMTNLGVSEDGNLQYYGQTDAAKQFLYGIKSLKNTFVFSNNQVTLVIFVQNIGKNRLLGI